jgi:hypothetical protein
MSELFESQKQEVLERLVIEYAPKKYPWWNLNGITYTSTNKIANTPPFYDASDARMSFKRSIYKATFAFLFYTGWTLIAFFAIKWIGFFIGCFGIILIIKSAINLFDRNLKLKLDKQGICTGQSENQIPWINVVATYIKASGSGTSYDCNLLIHFFNDKNKSFEYDNLYLVDLDSRYERVAFSIEYYKMISEAV